MTVATARAVRLWCVPSGSPRRVCRWCGVAVYWVVVRGKRHLIDCAAALGGAGPTAHGDGAGREHNGVCAARWVRR